MRILVAVRSNFPEIRKMSKEHGFLGNNNQPRVSRDLSFTLTECGDGNGVNTPQPVKIVYDIVRFRISEFSKESLCKEFMDRNDKK